MVKHRIGQAKMKAAKDRRLERGRVKMERKRERHNNCVLFATIGRHKPKDDPDCCGVCGRPFRFNF